MSFDWVIQLLEMYPRKLSDMQKGKIYLRNKRQTKAKQKREAVIVAAFQTSLTRRPYQEFKAGSVNTFCTFLPFKT